MLTGDDFRKALKLRRRISIRKIEGRLKNIRRHLKTADSISEISRKTRYSPSSIKRYFVAFDLALPQASERDLVANTIRAEDSNQQKPEKPGVEKGVKFDQEKLQKIKDSLGSAKSLTELSELTGYSTTLLYRYADEFYLALPRDPRGRKKAYSDGFVSKRPDARVIVRRGPWNLMPMFPGKGNGGKSRPKMDRLILDVN